MLNGREAIAIKARRGERGIALIAVLWGVALLALLAGSFAEVARTETLIAHNLVERTRAAALADAGIWRAVLALLDPVAERRWREDGAVQVLALADGEVAVSVQDEGGKIDLNAAPAPLLEGLLRGAGLDDRDSAALAERVADWRDEDDLRRDHGAEVADYRAAGRADGPKNADFAAVEELPQVLGLPAALYRRIAPALTVHSGRPEVDARTAPAQVLLSLPGMDQDRAQALLDERERPLAAPARSQIATWTIRATARTATGASFSREAVVRGIADSAQPFLVLAWRRVPGGGGA